MGLKKLVNKLMLQDLIIKIILLGNNESNIILIMDAKTQNCIKYINVIYHFVWRIVENRKVKNN